MPVVQQGAGDLMLDVPSRHCRRQWPSASTSRWSLLFGLLAAAAILTKGNGAALALVPPIALLLSRRFELLRRASVWIPVPIVAVLTGPWYLLTYSQVEPGFRYHWGVEYMQVALAANAHIVLLSAGPVLAAAAVVGRRNKLSSD
jgi:4-amino-4-deoxy-L-arabinose transferase-like glycosyltransferase